jgi:ribosome recycling factor
VNEDSIVDEALAEARQRMAKVVSHLQGEFASIRGGRASPALVDRIKVDYYGSEVPLKQLASITAPEARLLVIHPYDKSSLKSIEKAILASDLGVNPTDDGQVIRLSFPQLTAERRKELVKLARARAEEARVAVRNLRRAIRHELEAHTKKEEGGISEDEVERAERELERVTHEFVAEIDRMLEHKEQELLEI